MSEALYKAEAAAGQAQQPGGGAAGAKPNGGPQDGQVVDADFTEEK